MCTYIVFELFRTTNNERKTGNLGLVFASGLAQRLQENLANMPVHMSPHKTLYALDTE